MNWACDKFSTMSDVEDQMRVSAGFVYKAAAEERDKKIKEHQYPLPKKIGIDEHSMKKPKYQAVHYATIIADHRNKRVYDLLDGRSKADLMPVMEKMSGLKNVEFVTMDFSNTYRSIVRELMPHALIVVDHFHVKRCFTRLVNRFRKKSTGDKRKNPIRKLLLRNGDRLEDYERDAMWLWLKQNPDVREVYQYKEAITRIYRCKGLRRATTSLLNLIRKMQASKLEEVRSLAKTMNSWKREILAYHKCKLSNV